MKFLNLTAIDYKNPQNFSKVLACGRAIRKRYRRRQEEAKLRKAEQEAALAHVQAKNRKGL